MPCQPGPTELDPQIDDMQSQIERLTQDLCYLCGSLFDSGLLNNYASTRIVVWHTQHLASDTVRVRRAAQALYQSEPDANPSTVAEIMIKAARKVHPVSPWHVAWFREIAGEVAAELAQARVQAGDKKRLADQARALLSPEQLDAITNPK